MHNLTYSELLAKYQPKVIKDREQYNETLKLLEPYDPTHSSYENKDMSTDLIEFVNLIACLLEDYERQLEYDEFEISQELNVSNEYLDVDEDWAL